MAAKLPRFGSRGVYALGAAVVLLCGALLATGPVVRGVLGSRARAAGVRLEVGDVRLGLGTVTLCGVRLSSPELPGVHASLANVVVSPGLGHLRAVEIHGGTVTISGARDALEREWNAWRAAHSKAGARTKSDAALPVSADGIGVHWDRSAERESPIDVWGARYQRTSGGAEALGADLLRGSMAGVSVDLSLGKVGMSRDSGHRVVDAVSARRLDVKVDLDGRAGSHPADPQRLDTTSGLVAIDDPGPRLKAKLDRVGRALALWLSPSRALHVEGVHISAHHEGQVLNIRPAVIRAVRDASRVRLSVTSRASGASTPLGLQVTFPLTPSTIAVKLEGGPLSLATLGVEEHDMGLENVDRAEVEVNGQGTLSEDGRVLSVTGRSRFSDLSVYHPKLAQGPVRGLQLGLSGRAEIHLDGSAVRFDDVELAVGKVKIDARGAIERTQGDATGKVHVEVPLAACADMLASVPAALDPLLSGVEVEGTYALSGDLDFDTRRPGDTRVGWDVANECRISAVPASLSPERFSKPWTRTVLGPGAVPTTLESGPGTRDWTAFADISPYVATAVVVCEDASFWVHHGFNEKSIRDSIRDNLKAGKFLRGASTVSMQLAKNLYLEREKTLSRKLQEAVLTVLLEQSLSKEQILELYLNVIEFAPGLYGIGPAADHYFHTVPKDLSIAQAFYLVSILPNPKVHHFLADGTLSPRWADYLRHLMQIAFKIRKIDERDLSEGLGESVKFGEPSATFVSIDAKVGTADEDPNDVLPPEGDEGP